MYAFAQRRRRAARTTRRRRRAWAAPSTARHPPRRPRVLQHRRPGRLARRHRHRQDDRRLGHQRRCDGALDAPTRTGAATTSAPAASADKIRAVTARSIALFALAALAEIGGAYLVWLGIKEHKGVAFVALGAMALTRVRRARGLPAQPRVRPRAGRLRRRVHHRLAAVGHGLRRFPAGSLRRDRRAGVPDRCRDHHVLRGSAVRFCRPARRLLEPNPCSTSTDPTGPTASSRPSAACSPTRRPTRSRARSSPSHARDGALAHAAAVERARHLRQRRLPVPAPADRQRGGGGLGIDPDDGPVAAGAAWCGRCWRSSTRRWRSRGCGRSRRICRPSRARRFAAVRHLADLFDRYALHRPELIQAWAGARASTGRRSCGGG